MTEPAMRLDATELELTLSISRRQVRAGCTGRPVDDMVQAVGAALQ